MHPENILILHTDELKIVPEIETFVTHASRLTHNESWYKWTGLLAMVINSKTGNKATFHMAGIYGETGGCLRYEGKPLVETIEKFPKVVNWSLVVYNDIL